MQTDPTIRNIGVSGTPYQVRDLKTKGFGVQVYLAENPNAGDVIAGAGGCRKARWSLAGTGKSGGVRVIYFNRLDEGVWCC